MGNWEDRGELPDAGLGACFDNGELPALDDASERAEALRALDRALRNVPLEQPSATFQARLRASIAHEAQRSPFPWTAVFGLSAIALPAVLIAIGWWYPLYVEIEPPTVDGTVIAARLDALVALVGEPFAWLEAGAQALVQGVLVNFATVWPVAVVLVLLGFVANAAATLVPSAPGKLRQKRG